MEALSTFDSVGVVASAIVLVAYFALRQIALRMGDDVYSLFKRFARWVFGRGKRADGQGVTGAAEGIESTEASTAPAVSASRSTPLLADDFTAGKDVANAKPMLSTARGDYFAFEYFTAGDIAKLYRTIFRERATNQERLVVIKIARKAVAAPAMQNEVSILRELQLDSGAYGKHLPSVVEQFHTAEGNMGTVFEALEGLTLRQLRERFPAGIEPRHGLWMFRRGLSILGYAHGRGVLHGNLLPEHFLVRVRDHNVWLLDWTCAILRPNETGQGFRAADPVYAPPEARRGQAPIPASDLYALGKVMVYAFGGDPARDSLPETVPEPMARFTRFFLKESPMQRPRDAWEMYHVLEKIRDELYGPHRFVELVVD